MKFFEKNIVFSIMLFLGMLFCYNLIFQIEVKSESTELTSENSSSSDFFFLDLDLEGDKQTVFNFNFVSFAEKKIKNNHFHLPSTLSSTVLKVWLPPKLI